MGSMDGSVRIWKFDEAACGFTCAAMLPSAVGPVFALHAQLPEALWVGAYQGAVLVAFADGVVKFYDPVGKEQFSHGPLGEHTTNTAASILRHPREGKDILMCGQEWGYVTAYDLPDFRPRGTF